MRYPTAKLDLVRLFMEQFDRLQRTESTTVEDWVALKLSCSIEEAARLVEAQKRRARHV